MTNITTEAVDELQQLDIDTFEIEDVADPGVDMVVPPWGCICSSCSSCCNVSNAA